MSDQYLIERLLRYTERPGIDELIDFLNTSDYYKAPGSTTFHNTFVGGLAKHSLDVTALLFGKNVSCNMKVKDSSVILVGLLHDLCKVDYYVPKEFLGQHPETDVAIEHIGWKHEDKFPLGHGIKSLVIAQKYIQLTTQEQMMIRWHMGPFEISGHYSGLAWVDAQKQFPEVVATHTSDFESSAFYRTKSSRAYHDRMKIITEWPGPAEPHSSWYDKYLVLKNEYGEVVWEMLRGDLKAKDDKEARYRMDCMYGHARWRDE